MLRTSASRILKWLSESHGCYWHHLSPSLSTSPSLSSSINSQVNPSSQMENVEKTNTDDQELQEAATTYLPSSQRPAKALHSESAGVLEADKQGDHCSGSAVKTDGESSGLEEREELEEEELGVPVEEQRSLRLAVIGAPNAGKSTLINHLIGQKVLAVSAKAHTTNRRALGVFTMDNTQIELTDTPGVIPVSYARSLHMSREFTVDPSRSLINVDLVAVMVDASNKYKREQLDLSVLRLLEKHACVPSILILNKVDLIRKKTVLLKLTENLTGSDETDKHRMGMLVRQWKDKRVPVSQKTEVKKELDKLRKELATKKRLKEDRLWSLKKAHLERDGKLSEVAEEEKKRSKKTARTTSLLLESPPPLAKSCWPYFKEVFMISAMDGDGVSKLMDYLIENAVPRPWDYSVSEVTDQPALSLVEDIIREKICLYTDKEVPYVIKQENVIWEPDECGGITIYQNLYCGKRSRAAILIGEKGRMINAIKDEATRDIEALLKCPVFLTLHVKK